jgi:hypothetical protein
LAVIKNWLFGLFKKEKTSDINGDFFQPICKVSVSRLARGFAPRFGKRIFKGWLGLLVAYRRNDFLSDNKIYNALNNQI